MASRTFPVSSTVVDSILFRDAFGTAKMRALFSDHSLVQRYIDVEVALAKAEARVGVIPAEAADVIAREASIERIDFDHMREETDIVGYPILPEVRRVDRESRREILHIRHHSLYTPRDFDVSPFFAVVKPTIETGFNYKSIQWDRSPAPERDNTG